MSKVIKSQIRKTVAAVHAINARIAQCGTDTASITKELRAMARGLNKPNKSIEDYVINMQGSTKAQRIEMLMLLQRYSHKTVWDMNLYTHLTHKADIGVSTDYTFQMDDGKWSTILKSQTPANSNIVMFIIALRHATKG